MGVQVVGEKKRKLAERETGLTIDRILRRSNYRWEARVLHFDGHEHLRIDPQTWTVTVETPQACWATCKELSTTQQPRKEAA